MDNNTIDLEALNKSLGALVKSVIEEGKIQAIIKQQYPCLHEAVEAYRSEVVRINAGLPKSVWDSLTEWDKLREPRELTPVEKLLAGRKVTVTIGGKSFDVVLEASFEDKALTNNAQTGREYTPKPRPTHIDHLLGCHNVVKGIARYALVLILKNGIYYALESDAVSLNTMYGTPMYDKFCSDGTTIVSIASFPETHLDVALKALYKSDYQVAVAELTGDNVLVGTAVTIYSKIVGSETYRITTVDAITKTPIEVVKSNRLDTNPLDNGTFDV